MRCNRCLFVVLWVLFVATPVAASAVVVPISQGWKLNYGNHDTWSATNFDDSKWESVEVPHMLAQLHEQPTTAWYRVHFSVHDLVKQQALLIDYIRHADEVWLNGVKIGGEGGFSLPWRFSHTNPQSLIRVYEIPSGLLQDHDNVLAIKIRTGFGEAWGAMFPGGAGILGKGVFLGDAEVLFQLRHQSQIEASSIDVFFIALGLVDIVIIIFLLRSALGVFPEFRWLVLTSVMMLLGSFAHDVFFLHRWSLIPAEFVLIIAVLGTPFSIALFFWSQSRDISSRSVKLLAAVWGVQCLLVLVPSVSASIKVWAWYIWSVMTLIFFIYAFFCAFRGVYQKRVGAWFQLLALTVYFVSIRSQWLPDDLLGHRNVQVGSLIYRYALLFAFFQKVRALRLDYKQLSSRVVNVADDIRRDLARELHDGLGQHLASIKLHTQLLKRGGGAQVIASHFGIVEKELDESVTGLRRLINGLHPVALDRYSFAEAAAIESKNLEQVHTVRVHLAIDPVEFSKQTEQHLFRIFQECVGNAIHHGKADNITFILNVDGRRVSIQIRDDGMGFDVLNEGFDVDDQGGFGFVSLRERVVLLDGVMRVRSIVDEGTVVSIVFSDLNKH